MKFQHQCKIYRMISLILFNDKNSIDTKRCFADTLLSKRIDRLLSSSEKRYLKFIKSPTKVIEMNKCQENGSCAC